MTSLVKNLGVTIRQLRMQRGLSQEQLADRSELNRSYVGEVELGQVVGLPQQSHAPAAPQTAGLPSASHVS